MNPDTVFTWRWIDDLIQNGSFETGLSPGWYTGGTYPNTWQVYTAPTNAYGMGFRSATTFMPFAVSTSNGQLIQDIYIPSDAVSATLQWKERMYSINLPTLVGRLRVLIYQGGSPVALLEDYTGKEPQFQSFNWLTRSTNLLAYAGQNIQIVFQVNTYRALSDFEWWAEVDGFSFTSEHFSGLPEFQVYLGKSTPLRTTNLVGSTWSLNYAPPPLDPLTTYYWRIGVVRDGVTNYSSTATFKTGKRNLPLTVTDRTPTSLKLVFPSLASRYYAIEQADDMSTVPVWTEIMWLGAGTGNPMEVEIPLPPQETAYWRLRVTP